MKSTGYANLIFIDIKLGICLSNIESTYINATTWASTPKKFFSYCLAKEALG